MTPPPIHGQQSITSTSTRTRTIKAKAPRRCPAPTRFTDHQPAIQDCISRLGFRAVLPPLPNRSRARSRSLNVRQKLSVAAFVHVYLPVTPPSYPWSAIDNEHEHENLESIEEYALRRRPAPTRFTDHQTAIEENIPSWRFGRGDPL
jgi:hypothetical protein